MLRWQVAAVVLIGATAASLPRSAKADPKPVVISSTEGPATIKDPAPNGRNKKTEVDAALQILIDFLNVHHVRIVNENGKDKLRIDPPTAQEMKNLATALNEAAPGGL